MHVEALGRGGELGDARYAARMKPLLDMKPAYDKHDKAIAAARKKDYAQARALAQEAATAVPERGSLSADPRRDRVGGERR